MTQFRPCIDLHDGRVKQIVGSSLRDDGTGLKTNFVSDRDAAWYGELYKCDGLKGGHVILLGKGNEEAAKAATGAFPGGLQVGGGIRSCNAAEYLEAGASHVIVTSYLFETDGTFNQTRLDKMVAAAGKERLVIDLSCKATATGWTVAMNRWQTLTTLDVTPESLHFLAGIDEALVSFLGEHSPIPMTYAGGIRHLDDLKRIDELSHGRVDGTVGSALDLFGGTGAKYEELVAWNRRKAA
jgi:phosphoribosylformimino-5-aminoimidazole carboxamide ribotide isomerase